MGNRDISDKYFLTRYILHNINFNGIFFVNYFNIFEANVHINNKQNKQLKKVKHRPTFKLK